MGVLAIAAGVVAFAVDALVVSTAAVVPTAADVVAFAVDALGVSTDAVVLTAADAVAFAVDALAVSAAAVVLTAADAVAFAVDAMVVSAAALMIPGPAHVACFPVEQQGPRDRELRIGQFLYPSSSLFQDYPGSLYQVLDTILVPEVLDICCCSDEGVCTQRPSQNPYKRFRDRLYPHPQY